MKKLFLILAFVLLFAAKGECGTKTWQNGGVDNNWSTAGNWAEGSKPAAGDDVVMSANYNCVINEATANLKSFDMTGYPAVLSGSSNITVVGASSATVNCIFANGASNTWSGTLNVNPASSGTINLTCGGSTTWNAVTQNGAGTVSLQDTMALAATKIFTLTNGSFNSNGNAMNIGRGVVQPGADGFNITNSTITFSGTTASVFSCEVASATPTVTGSTLVFTGSGATMGTGGKTWNNITFSGGGTSSFTNVTSDITIAGTLSLQGTASLSDRFEVTAGRTLTISSGGTLNVDGNSNLNRFLLTSDTLGSSFNLVLTGVTISGCSNSEFRDIAFTGSPDFSSITGGSGDCGGNSGATWNAYDNCTVDAESTGWITSAPGGATIYPVHYYRHLLQGASY